jgi:hypothetical protein
VSRLQDFVERTWLEDVDGVLEVAVVAVDDVEEACRFSLKECSKSSWCQFYKTFFFVTDDKA